jgi:hypothetical protein
MWSLIQSHQLIVGAVAMWFLSSAIGALPTPHDGSSQFYEWFFKFSQTVGGAIPRLMAIYFPTTLNALTGQTTKLTIPPNPPISDGSASATKENSP